MNARLCFIITAALLLTGCMVGPNYQRPAMELPVGYPGAPAAPGASDAVRADWWALFNDPTLNGLVETALTNNFDVQKAVARIEETNANLRAVDAAFLPEIDLGASANRSRASSAVAFPPPAGAPSIRNDLRLAISSSFELDFWGRLRRSAEAARAQALGSRYAKEVVTLSLASLTTQAYFALRSLDAQIATTRDTLATRDEGLGLVRRRVDAGYASDLELRQTEGARADISVQLKELIRQRAVVEHQLGVLTARLDLTIAPGNLALMPQPAVPPPGLPSALLERRPDVRVAEQQLVAENALIGVAMAAQLPTISLTGNYGGESKALASLFTGPGRIWAIGVGLTTPIFDSGKLAALADAERARYKQTLAAYEQTVEISFREVADALTNLQQYATSEADLQASVDATRDALRLARKRYEAGYSGYLEVLDAQRTLNLGELALIRNRQALLGAGVDLMKALGGGWSPEQAAAM